MNTVEFPAYIEIAVKPGYAKAIACWAGMALTLALGVAGIALGMTVSVFVFLLAYYLWRLSKSAQKCNEVTLVKAKLGVDRGDVELLLPASRLFGSRYVDQCYLLSQSKGGRIALSKTGELVLSGRLVSEALEAGEVLDHREHDDAEVKMTVASEYAREELGRLLAENGW